MPHLIKVAAAAAVTLALTTGGFMQAALAETIEVQLLNKHPDDPRKRSVFYPNLIRANPGDTIKFVAVNKGHNVQSVKGGIPDGVEKFKSKTSKDFELTVDVEGTYAIKCTPHYAIGMVALILVGDYTSNFDAVKGVKHRGKAKAGFADLYAMAAEMN